jgi:hypothetical protein
MFSRRLGPDPHSNGALTAALQGCPDILELEDGDFAIIPLCVDEWCGSRAARGLGRAASETRRFVEHGCEAARRP